ncbi:unnamed protein product [Rhizoctonia solani]|uniref:Uncharacterized protein n=1 Tax=Rhizoctonia solani TaxID=456999 RepID=A0A8H3GCF5_9AGAM|nr:unnamed protein product [Rhizoctonia solani]
MSLNAISGIIGLTLASQENPVSRSGRTPITTTKSRTGNDSGSPHEEDRRSQNQTENTLGPVPEQDTNSEPKLMGTTLSVGTHLSHEELYELGVFHCERFWRWKRLDDIQKAIKYGIVARDLTPEDHPDWPLRLADLGVFYDERFKRLGELEDLEKAIQLKTRALIDISVWVNWKT